VIWLGVTRLFWIVGRIESVSSLLALVGLRANEQDSTRNADS